MLASLFFYLKRTSRPRVLQSGDAEEEVLRIEGSIFFGACPYVQRLIQRSQGKRLRWTPTTSTSSTSPG